MYESLFGMTHRPFTGTPLLETRQFSEATQALIQNIHEGFHVGLLIGETGAGKSSLCMELPNTLSDSFRIVYVAHSTFATPRALLQAILYELGRSSIRMSEQELRLELLNAAREAIADQRPLVILLDDAHRMTALLMSEVQVLSQFVENGEPLVRLLLSGENSLGQLLEKPEFELLLKRVSSEVHLGKLSEADSRQFLKESLEQVGVNLEDVLTAEGIGMICKTANGLPGCLNQLADHSFLLAYIGDVTPVGVPMIRDALIDLQQLPLQWHDSNVPNSASENLSTTAIGHKIKTEEELEEIAREVLNSDGIKSEETISTSPEAVTAEVSVQPEDRETIETQSEEVESVSSATTLSEPEHPETRTFVEEAPANPSTELPAEDLLTKEVPREEPSTEQEPVTCVMEFGGEEGDDSTDAGYFQLLPKPLSEAGKPNSEETQTVETMSDVTEPPIEELPALSDSAPADSTSADSASADSTSTMNPLGATAESDWEFDQLSDPIPHEPEEIEPIPAAPVPEPETVAETQSVSEVETVPKHETTAQAGVEPEAVSEAEANAETEPLDEPIIPEQHASEPPATVSHSRAFEELDSRTEDQILPMLDEVIDSLSAEFAEDQISSEISPPEPEPESVEQAATISETPVEGILETADSSETAEDLPEPVAEMTTDKPDEDEQELDVHEIATMLQQELQEALALQEIEESEQEALTETTVDSTIDFPIDSTVDPTEASLMTVDVPVEGNSATDGEESAAYASCTSTLNDAPDQKPRKRRYANLFSTLRRRFSE